MGFGTAIFVEVLNVKINKNILIREKCVFDFLYAPFGDNDYDKAWKYAQWKYNISISNLKSVSVDLTQSELGLTTIFNNCTISRATFADENMCASVLGHENVHGGQSKIDRASSLSQWLQGGEHYIETEAYMWEINNASSTKISQSYLDDCWRGFRRYNRTSLPEDGNN